MQNNETENNAIQKNSFEGNVCDLTYLNETMSGKKPLIREIMDIFLTQIPEELQFIKEGIMKENYAMIKKYSHTMKSSVSIMGITLLNPILREMEDLGTAAKDIEKIKQLNNSLNLICEQALNEIEKVKHNYA